MYLWNTKKLADELKNDTISEKSVFGYMALYFASLSFQQWSQFYDRQNPSVDTTYELGIGWQVSFQVIATCIMFLSLIICWNQNRKGDNKDFLKRYFCLHIPLSIKLFVVLMVFFPIMSAVSMIFGIGLKVVYSFPFFMVIISLVILWRVWYYIGYISQPEQPALE